MKKSVHTTNIFKNADPEALKKAVTQKIEKLLNRQLKRGAEHGKSRDLLPSVD